MCLSSSRITQAQRRSANVVNRRKDTPLSRIVGKRTGSWLVQYLESWIETRANSYLTKEQTVKELKAKLADVQEQVDLWAPGKPFPYKRELGVFSPSDMSNPCDAFLAFRFMNVKRQSHTGARLQR